ncbi:hypothetical protein HY624_01845 [Candidatus Uhrbacteria bacterium]|nr:hypothetical protein [Candidatus Uhrbacteria bacterium]
MSRRIKKIYDGIEIRDTTQDVVVVQKPKRKRKVSTKTKIPTMEAPVIVAAALPEGGQEPNNRRVLLWSIVSVIGVAIIGVWILLFRWNVQGVMDEGAIKSSVAMRDELGKTVQEFQQNFSSITTLIEERFAKEKKSADGTTTLSPDAVKELEERLRNTATEKTATTEGINFDIKTWQLYTSESPRIQARYPLGWALDTKSIGGERVAAFTRYTSNGTTGGISELFIDVRTNPERKTLKQFYTEANRTNLYQAARGGTETVYVDGIRAVAFHDVAQVFPSTIVSVRQGTFIFEFSILGTDEEHKKILQTFLTTVRLK